MSDKTEHPPLPEAFAALGVRPSILRALAEARFTTPSEIQALLIPRALAGVDILGQARTGTGKTAAFAIPMLQLCQRGVGTQGIILVPTRELAIQVQIEVERLGEFTPIRSAAVYGGQKITAQLKHLKTHPEILVGTPGRVIDLLDRRIIEFSNVRFAVLDEVDRMLDIGFRDDIRNILSRIKGVRAGGPGGDGPRAEEFERSREGSADDRGNGREDDGNGGHDEGGQGDASHSEAHDPHADHPTQRGRDTGSRPDRGRRHQTIFVSATISSEIEKLGRRYMQEPIEKLIAPGADDKPTVENVEQYYFSVQPWDKYRLVRGLLLKENPDLAIVFCRTKRGAEKLAKRLHADGIECREIHGNLDQAKRDRVMKNFRTGKFDVLIATDLASRGIDVADISHIINYDIPEDPEAYVHRIGRTARMGATGKAFTLVTHEQGEELTRVEELVNMVIPQAILEGFEASPTPADWNFDGPGAPPAASEPSKPVISRFIRPYGARSGGGSAMPAVDASSANDTDAGTSSAATGEPQASAPIPLPLPQRTLGSKIPINRRHKRRR